MIRRAFLFGDLRIVDEGGERRLVTRTQNERRLFVLLALSPTPQRRSVLAAQLWPDVPDEVRRTRLRYCLAMLRRAVGEEALVVMGGDALTLSSELWLDVRQFWKLVQGAVLSSDIETRIESLKEAVQVAQSPLLAGWSEPWVVRERHRLQVCRQDVLRALSEDLRAQGREAEAALWQHIISANDLPTSAI